jgi:hypothetical protein
MLRGDVRGELRPEILVLLGLTVIALSAARHDRSIACGASKQLRRNVIARRAVTPAAVDALSGLREDANCRDRAFRQTLVGILYPPLPFFPTRFAHDPSFPAQD